MTRPKLVVLGAFVLAIGVFVAIIVAILLDGPRRFPLTIRTLLVIGAGLCFGNGLLLVASGIAGPPKTP